jgi:hypothetical protein
MKKIIFLGLIIALIIGSCTQQEVKSPIEGPWQVVSWQRIAGDTLQWKLGVDFIGNEIKSWSKSHFLFVGRYERKKDTTFIDNYGGGTYKLDGAHCDESYVYFVDQKMVGTSQRILLEVKNDTLIQTWPCDENWQINKSNHNVQKLVRVE